MAAKAHIPQLHSEAYLQRYEDLLRATTAIAGYRDIETFRDRFAEELQRFVAFDYVVVLILDPDTQAVRWRMFHAPGRNEEVGEIPEFALHETPSGWVYANQAPLVIHDWSLETRYPRMREYLEPFGIRSTCVLPLTTVHRRVGVFSIGVSRPQAYSADEVQFLSLVADHFALAIDNAWNLEASRDVQSKLENKNDRLELVLELTNRLVSNLELRDLLREVSGSVRRVMKCDAAGVALPESEGNFRVYALDFPDSKGFLTEETLISMNSPIGAAYRTGKVELRSESQIQEHCPEACATSAMREGLRSGCFLPLISKDQVLGVLALSRFAKDPFTQEEIAFLTQIVRQIAIAIENALAFKEIAELKEKLAQEKLYLEDEIRGEMDFQGIVGQSSALRNVLRMVETVAGSDSTVLLLGETGTGKELIARAIHERSRRSDRTFVKLNCAAIPTGLLESELFGHEKGAFTGAISQKPGAWSWPIGARSFWMKLATFHPRSSPSCCAPCRSANSSAWAARIPSAWTCDCWLPPTAIWRRWWWTRQFRSDLFYRLNVFPIRIPPLRDGPRHSAAGPLLRPETCAQHGEANRKAPGGCHDELMHWHWPGNIRELAKFVERAVILTARERLCSSRWRTAKSSGHYPAPTGLRRNSSEREEIVRIFREASGRVGGPTAQLPASA